MAPLAPRTDIRRLRRMVDDPSLDIRFDEAAAEASGSEAWAVFYRNGEGRPVWLLDWPHPLLGNLEAIALKVRRVDFRHGRPKDYAAELDARRKRLADEKRRRRMEQIEDMTDYSANALRAWADGRPSCGSYGPSSTGKA